VGDGRPLLDDQRALEVANVIWCTGSGPDFSWIDLPVLGDNEPLHHRGIVASQPGLYFVGLFFLYAMSSDFSPASGGTPSTSPTTSPRANPTAMQRPVCRPEHCAPKAHDPARTHVRVHRPVRPARPRQLRRPGCDRRQQPASGAMRPAVPARRFLAPSDEPGNLRRFMAGVS
jgi:hypothetical protein